jgi:hypothetical protein
VRCDVGEAIFVTFVVFCYFNHGWTLIDTEIEGNGVREYWRGGVFVTEQPSFPLFSSVNHNNGRTTKGANCAKRGEDWSSGEVEMEGCPVWTAAGRPASSRAPRRFERQAGSAARGLASAPASLKDIVNP